MQNIPKGSSEMPGETTHPLHVQRAEAAIHLLGRHSFISMGPCTHGSSADRIILGKMCL